MLVFTDVYFDGVYLFTVVEFVVLDEVDMAYLDALEILGLL